MSELSITYIIERGGVDTGIRLMPYGGDNGSVSVSADAAIKLALTARIVKPQGVDFINDRLHVVITVDGAQYPLGRYVMTDAPSRREQNRTYVDLTAYGICYLLSCSTLDARRFYAAGTRYTNILTQLLQEAGIYNYVVTESAATLLCDRELEIGITLLDVLNALLSEMGYYTVWETMQGVVMCTPVRDIGVATVDVCYAADKHSILYPEAETDSDTFERYNRFVAVVENSDPTLCMRAEAINDRADSPISTVCQGVTVTKVVKLDNVANQDTLKAKAEQMRLESMMRTEDTVFYTGPHPVHTCFNVVQLQNGYENGIYEETGWSIELAAPCRMEHHGRRVIFT